MRALCITHVAFEGPARIGDWARNRGHSLKVVRADLPETSLSLQSHDSLVVMGGPMSANDDHDWLSSELKLIESALQQRIPVLGVCLGAQLLARALGARVFAASHKEIGWWPVHANPDPGSGEPLLPSTFVPFHWHGETFELPNGAQRLASSPVCENQAFVFGKLALGLQFHVEASNDSVGDIVREGADDLTGGPWVQTAAAMLADCSTRCAAIEATCYSLLDSFFEGAGLARTS
jgi:GMP synthase-like glutamine amidotransferase